MTVQSLFFGSPAMLIMKQYKRSRHGSSSAFNILNPRNDPIRFRKKTFPHEPSTLRTSSCIENAAKEIKAGSTARCQFLFSKTIDRIISYPCCACRSLISSFRCIIFSARINSISKSCLFLCSIVCKRIPTNTETIAVNSTNPQTISVGKLGTRPVRIYVKGSDRRKLLTAAQERPPSIHKSFRDDKQQKAL